jgi:hypothetical protein
MLLPLFGIIGAMQAPELFGADDLARPMAVPAEMTARLPRRDAIGSFWITPR